MLCFARSRVAGGGRGGTYAEGAGDGRRGGTDRGAEDIARRGLLIAFRLCIYPNDTITVETLDLASPVLPPAVTA